MRKLTVKENENPNDAPKMGVVASSVVFCLLVFLFFCFVIRVSGPYFALSHR